MEELLNNSLEKYFNRLSAVGRIDDCLTEKMLVLDFINKYKSIILYRNEHEERLIDNILLCIIGESCIFEQDCKC